MRVVHGGVAFELPEGFVDQTAVSLVRPASQAYPMSVTLTLDLVGGAPGPLVYLKLKLEQLRPSLQGYKLRSCEATQVGAHPGARAEFSFEAPPELCQLVLVFFAGPKLACLVLSTLPDGVSEGWRIIDRLASTIDLAP